MTAASPARSESRTEIRDSKGRSSGDPRGSYVVAACWPPPWESPRDDTPRDEQVGQPLGILPICYVEGMLEQFGASVVPKIELPSAPLSKFPRGPPVTVKRAADDT